MQGEGRGTVLHTYCVWEPGALSGNTSGLHLQGTYCVSATGEGPYEATERLCFGRAYYMAAALLLGTRSLNMNLVLYKHLPCAQVPRQRICQTAGVAARGEARHLLCA